MRPAEQIPYAATVAYQNKSVIFSKKLIKITHSILKKYLHTFMGKLANLVLILRQKMWIEILQQILNFTVIDVTILVLLYHPEDTIFVIRLRLMPKRNRSPISLY